MKNKRSKGELDRFRVNRIELKRKYLWLEVIVFSRPGYMARGSYHLGINARNTMGLWRPVFPKDVRINRGRIGTMRLVRGRNLELIAMHESVHAAFGLSAYRKRWPVDGDDREEFIARVAEYIFGQIQRRLRVMNYYRYT